MATTVHDFSATSIEGTERQLGEYRDKVLLIVNTASECGFTPQYEELEAIYQQYKDRGFEVLGFPCNQFGKQEPGSEEQIQTFCTTRFGVTFPLFSKIDVNGRDAHPLYRHLKESAPGVLGTKDIKWNFTKFLVDAEGKTLNRYAPSTSPKSITDDIEAVLKG